MIARFNSMMAWETEALRLDPECVLHGVQAVLEDDSKGFYVVAMGNEEVVGQLMITYEWSDWRNGTFWWIQSVYVTENYRRRGVFRSLYEWVQEQARSNKNVCGLRLYVERDNDRAQRTYQDLGMQVTAYKMLEIDYRLQRPPAVGH